MTRAVGFLCAALLILVPVARDADAQEQAPRRSVAQPSITLPAELGRVLRDYERAWRAGDLRLRALAFATADTVGYIIGAYGCGDASGDQGKFTLALRRAPEGRWLIASDMDNGS